MSSTNTHIGASRVAGPRAWLVWALALLLFWWLLVEGRLDGWWYAIPVVLAALALRRALPIPLALQRVNLLALIAFLPRFVWHSLVGGVDVAWRAFHPSMPLTPAMFMYPFRLQSDGARVFLAQIISLMPGTLSCCVGPRHLVVHVLSGTREAFLAETAAFERRTARIFREDIGGGGHG